MTKKRRLNIAHIIQDEKFPDSAFDAFEEVLPGCSDYILPGVSHEIRNLKKIKPIRVSRFECFNPLFFNRLKQYDVVLLHGLTKFCCELVGRSKGRINFIWIGMGFDYYDLIYKDHEDLLKAETRAIHREFLLAERKRAIVIFRNSIKSLIYKYLDKKADAIKNIKYFAPVLKCEYETIKKLYPSSINSYVEWNYGPMASLVDGEIGVENIDGDNILVGNSAAVTNNHIDAFKLLSNIQLIVGGSSKVIVPLSYGNKIYRDIVIEYGQLIFGENFCPVLKFMDHDNYIRLISSCSSVIMNHKRQQAGGNIEAALYLGARVFVDKENAFYKEYVDNGAVINSLDDLENNPWLIKTPLTQEEKIDNKNILRNMRGWESVMRKTKNLIDMLDCEYSHNYKKTSRNT